MSLLWAKILETSSLARALQEVHESISNNRIATIHLDSVPVVDLTMHIPVPLFLSRLPKNTEYAMPGLWLTSADGFEGDGSDSQRVLNRNFALLLLDDEAKIMADVRTAGENLASPLTILLSVSKPSMS